VVVVELQGQLLARGAGRGELDSREGAIAVWEDGLAALELALGKVHMEHDSSCVWVEVVQQDFFAQACASSSRSRQLIDLNRMLGEWQILLCL
jgi:hypothetical protein